MANYHNSFAKLENSQGWKKKEEPFLAESWAHLEQPYTKYVLLLS